MNAYPPSKRYTYTVFLRGVRIPSISSYSLSLSCIGKNTFQQMNNWSRAKLATKQIFNSREIKGNRAKETRKDLRPRLIRPTIHPNAIQNLSHDILARRFDGLVILQFVLSKQHSRNLNPNDPMASLNNNNNIQSKMGRKIFYAPTKWRNYQWWPSRSCR